MDILEISPIESEESASNSEKLEHDRKEKQPIPPTVPSTSSSSLQRPSEPTLNLKEKHESGRKAKVLQAEMASIHSNKITINYSVNKEEQDKLDQVKEKAVKDKKKEKRKAS